ncbi:hypothetical protein [Streptomyces sp. CA2R101]|uniref:hypothetical protein n=1 Tax=Streptomyces sp. CA2R101 TaxID=3120152 RepID=UPI0030090DE2
MSGPEAAPVERACADQRARAEETAEVLAVPDFRRLWAANGFRYAASEGLIPAPRDGQARPDPGP